jgi:hypothetical protein
MVMDETEKRYMGLKIIGSGFGRTGTMSTYAALNQLGIPCYHMIEVFTNKMHLDFWWKVANAPAGNQHDWNQVFADYAAAVDNPACCVWRELMAAYPDAKVLLTLHPKGPEAWYESMIETMTAWGTWPVKVAGWVKPFGRRKMNEMSHNLIWKRSHKGTLDDRAKAVAHYRQHIEDVKAAVPPEKLLIFSVDQGWEPLCKFLSVPVPATPFPNVNDRAAVKKFVAKMTRDAYLILAAGAVILAALLYCAARLLT